MGGGCGFKKLHNILSLTPKKGSLITNKAAKNDEQYINIPPVKKARPAKSPNQALVIILYSLMVLSDKSLTSLRFSSPPL